MLASSKGEIKINWSQTTAKAAGSLDFSQVSLVSNGEAKSGKLTINKDKTAVWRSKDAEHAFTCISPEMELIVSENDTLQISKTMELRFASFTDCVNARNQLSSTTPISAKSAPKKRTHRKSLTYGQEEDEEDAEDDELEALQTLRADENTKPMDYRQAARILASQTASMASKEFAAKQLSTQASAPYPFLPQANLVLRFSSTEERAAWEKQEFMKIYPQIRAMKADDDAERARVERETGVSISRAAGSYRYTDTLTNAKISAQDFAQRYAEKILCKTPASLSPSGLSKEEEYQVALQRATEKLHAQFDKALQEFKATKALLQQRLYL